MNIVRAILSELVGMFVDDENLAIHAIALIAAVALAVKLASLPPLFGGLLLLVGCIAILLDSIRRGARR
jgi:thiamine transporter ThiT